MTTHGMEYGSSWEGMVLEQGDIERQTGRERMRRQQERGDSKRETSRVLSENGVGF